MSHQKSPRKRDAKVVNRDSRRSARLKSMLEEWQANTWNSVLSKGNQPMLKAQQPSYIE